MLTSEEILQTIRMLREEHLDIRTITLGISLHDCALGSTKKISRAIYKKITKLAKNLNAVCNELSQEYGVPIINKRLAVSPVSEFKSLTKSSEYIILGKTLDRAAQDAGIDLIGGYTLLAPKKLTPQGVVFLNSIPEVLSKTDRVCASVHLASSHAGINMDGVRKIGEIIKETAKKTAKQGGIGCAKLVIFANMPEDNPFMAGAYLGSNEPESTINVGISGPGAIRRALMEELKDKPDLSLGELAEIIKKTSFKITRVGELIGMETAKRLNIPFGIVDLSLAPTPTPGDSVGEILQCLGIKHIGSPGTTAALSLLTDAVKKGGAFASSSIGGLSGAFIPVSEDAVLSRAVKEGSLSLEKLEAMTAICSVGLDMIPLPGNIKASTLSAIIADELSIGVINHKSAACRLIPVPGKKAGQKVVWGGLFGESYILPVTKYETSEKFIKRGGKIPAPLTSLKN